MAINFTEAVRAYEKIARQDSIQGPDIAQPKGGTGFSDVLREATESAVSSLREGEAQSLQAAAGTADINDVVMAVGKAEMTLQTVVTLRDKVIGAYQEILRMPI
jgi:flagellar hook-basal body complex protein FliE